MDLILVAQKIENAFKHFKIGLLGRAKEAEN